MPRLNRYFQNRGFSLIELLIVIAVIGILASLVIGQIANAAQESRRIVSRQQQVVMQNAVNAWVLAYAAQEGALEKAREVYNKEGAATRTARSKLQLIAEYLDKDTLEQFLSHSDPTEPDKLRTDAMVKTGRYIELPPWGGNEADYPEVHLLPPN